MEENMKTFAGYQKGINLGGWLSQCVSYDEEHFNTFITKKDIEQIASWGLDHIRLPVDFDVLENHHHLIENCISWCKEYGLKIILDLHKTKGFMFDIKAVPDPDKFFTDKSLQDDFVEIWRDLIIRYGKYKDMIAFELLNEVVKADFAKKWNEIAERTIKMIREYEKDAYILVGGVWHNSINAVPMLDAPYDEYIVYNFHCYEPLCFTHQHATWVDNIDFDLNYPAPIELYREKSFALNQNQAGAVFSEKLKEIGPEFFDIMFKSAIEYAEKNNAPLYCGEYGVIDQAPVKDTVNWLKDINSIFTKYGIGRALWNYKQKDFGIIDEHYSSVKDEMIKYL